MDTKPKRPKVRPGLRERAEQLCRASDGSPLGDPANVSSEGVSSEGVSPEGVSSEDVSPEGVSPEDVSPEAMRQALHELRVHQIELEMQNEELRRAQLELDAERERYFELYDLAPVGYCTLSEKGLIQQANLTASSLLGVARSALTGRPFSRFILKDDQDIYYKHWKKLFAAGEPLSTELRMVKPGEVTFWVRLEATVVGPDSEQSSEQSSGRQIGRDGKTPACRVMLIDITERKQAEELHTHVEHIIQHDLRSPALNAMAVVSLLRHDPNLNDSQRELLGLLENAGQQMLRTLSRALDLYKIEEGQYRGVAERFDCVPLVQEIFETLRLTPHHASATLELLVDGAAPAPNACALCLGQPDLLRAALHNLTQNALEASPEGAAVTLELLSGPGGGNCRIEIRNRGAVLEGIRERFFEKFATMGKRFGTGLGTYSAKKMIEAQGGSIAMRTCGEKDETVLVIRLPV